MTSDRTHVDDQFANEWTLQFTIEAERAKEYIDLYRSLGNEVRIEVVDPDSMQEDCSSCLKAASDKIGAICIRFSKTESSE
jgi:hypothetical protein